MKNIILTLIICIAFGTILSAQGNVEIEGTLKVENVPAVGSSDSIIVKAANGLIGQQSKESINDRSAQLCALGYYVLPANFDFQYIPSSHANAIWEIRHCHDLQNASISLPENVILNFKGGKLINFQNLNGDYTTIEAYSHQIFDGTTISGTWTLAHVNVAWFGAIANPNFDSEPAFDKASVFANANEGIRKIIVPSGIYHLENPWRISSTGDIWNPINIEGFGAVLDNTVIVATRGVGLKGLTVDGASRHGFVFIRGQGAHHEHLLASNCGLDGFYCGSDLGDGEYGPNFQVTRSVFTSLTALANGRHGWYMEGEATANRSWFNANSVIGFAAVNNAEKGFAWTGGSEPNGPSQINYNSFFNMNCEGNGSISVDLPESRANTFIGGHFVDLDTDDFCMKLGEPYNVNLGGRYVGKVEEPSFIYANTAEAFQGGIISKITGVDVIQTQDLEVANEPFFPQGWSIIPKERESYVQAADNLNNHQFTIDLNTLPNANAFMLRLNRFGQRNFSNGFEQKYSYALLLHVNINVSGQMHLNWNRLSDDQNCTINSVTLNAGVITVDFNTNYITFGGGYGVTEYQNSGNTDFR